MQVWRESVLTDVGKHTPVQGGGSKLQPPRRFQPTVDGDLRCFGLVNLDGPSMGVVAERAEGQGPVPPSPPSRRLPQSQPVELPAAQALDQAAILVQSVVPNFVRLTRGCAPIKPW
jgi:hypothetical protein